MQIEVLQRNATRVEADALALKYAQRRYGLDFHVAQLLREAGHPDDAMRPQPGQSQLLPGIAGIAAKSILFVGVEPLWDFGYHQIRVFARKVLSSLASQLPATRRVVVTVHGPGYGLDEEEAFMSQLAGFFDAVETDDAPKQLEVITFAEREKGRAQRLQGILGHIVPSGRMSQRGLRLLDATKPESRERLRAAGYTSASRAHVFVAMPFSDDLGDVYHYGILNAVNRAGLLCERADLASFTGDVIGWVRERIKTASLLIADLSGANPNVYLEVGFAWGCGIPTVLLARNVDELRFDVRGQRCLLYRTIKDLEEKLSIELKGLNTKST